MPRFECPSKEVLEQRWRCISGGLPIKCSWHTITLLFQLTSAFYQLKYEEGFLALSLDRK